MSIGNPYRTNKARSAKKHAAAPPSRPLDKQQAAGSDRPSVTGWHAQTPAVSMSDMPPSNHDNETARESYHKAFSAFCGRADLKNAYCTILRNGYRALHQVRADLGEASDAGDLINSERPISVSEAIGNQHNKCANILVEELQIPGTFLAIMDEVFMLLPEPDAISWPHALFSAIPVGADLSPVWPDMAKFLLYDQHLGVFRFAGHEARRLAAQYMQMRSTGATTIQGLTPDDMTINALISDDNPSVDNVVRAAILAESEPLLAAVAISNALYVSAAQVNESARNRVMPAIALRYASWVIDRVQRTAVQGDSTRPTRTITA